jgi:hypothetical protein
MKLEYLDDLSNSGEHPNLETDELIRLYDFDKAEATLLYKAIQEIVIKEQKPLELSTLAFIQAVNCSLTFRIAEEDLGIAAFTDTSFFCYLTPDGYKNMLRLIEPYCTHKSQGYQWLYEVDTDIDLLFSPGGSW